MEASLSFSFCSKGMMNRHGEHRLPVFECKSFGVPNLGQGVFISVNLKWFSVTYETHRSMKGGKGDGEDG
jgi:hypothetical protein